MMSRVLADKGFVINLYRDSLVTGGKLVDYYQAQVTHESCPYSQTTDTLTQAINTMKHFNTFDMKLQIFETRRFSRIC